MKRAVCTFLHLLIAIVIHGLSTAQAENTAVVKIGGIYGLSGALASMSGDIRDSAQLAIEDLNLLAGPQLELLTEDSAWDPKRAVAAFYKLVNIDKVSIIHTVGSSVSLAIKPLSEQRGILHYTEAAHGELTANSKFMLRHSNSAQMDGMVLAADVAVPHPARVALIALQDDWSDAFQKGFNPRLRDLSPETRVRTETHLREDSDFRSPLLRLFADKPEALVISSYGPQIALILKQARELGFAGQIFVNNGLTVTPEAHELVRKSGVCGFRHLVYREPPAAFIEAFQKRFKRRPNNFTVCSYTDMEIIHHALKNAGSDTARLAAFIRSLGHFEGRYQKVEISPTGEIPMFMEVEEWKCEKSQD